ncbi:MAG: endonuclease III domain-containing protein [bacterium]|nr:MAG: endonuclease III domain-containing protein [bacterium]
MGRDGRFVEVYEALAGEYGPRRWWPVTPPGGTRPEYIGGPRTRQQRFEMAVGAVLTQNTAWNNAAEAIVNLNRTVILDPTSLYRINERRLADLVRPSGYYNQKAKRLKALAAFFTSGRDVNRDNLLTLDGIGPETADSILLYAFDHPIFVVDAYTRRLFDRLAMIDAGAPYDEVQAIFQSNLPRDVHIYKEYHALIVEHGKCHCRKRPSCEGCVLLGRCSVEIEGSDHKNRKLSQ